ncbi:MAG: fimbrillin family protein, partial [Bacteroidales bacterium]|nr:fimbrillin family protein [Bacteroidales bacterium]
SSSEMLSRAIVSNDDELQTTHLGVFAYKEVAGKKTRVFNNVELVFENGAWTYSPLKYWDRTASYYFVSYSPHQDANISFNQEDNQLVINNIPTWQSIDDNTTDYVIATVSGSAQDFLSPSGAKSVSFEYEHILAQLEVRVVKNALLMNDYTLSQVDYTNAPVLGTTVEFLHLSSPNGEFMGMDSKVMDQPQTMASPDNAVVGAEANENTAIKHLVAPFDAGDDKLKITINYAINGTAQEPKTVATDLQTVEANQRYVLTLRFESGTVITPTLEIEPWKNIEVDEPKYNW